SAPIVDRYHRRTSGRRFTPGSESISERVAYARFLATVTATPTAPVDSRRIAAHSCVPMAPTPTPMSNSTNDSTCQRIECGRNANGWTSVRYTDGNAAVPQTPALIFVPHSDRTNGSGL